MNYLLSAISSSRSKRRIYALINSVVSRINPEDEKEWNVWPISPAVLSECVKIAESDKVNWLFLAFIDFLRPSTPVKAYGALKLLEYFVQRCNRNFHIALANCTRLHEKILNLAICRATEKSDNWDYSKKKEEDFLLSKQSRQAQRLARLTILEYSRIFVGDPLLEPLAALGNTFESRTKRNLFRAINIQERRVEFRKIEPSDVVLIVSDECYPSMQGMHSLHSSSSLTNFGVEPLARHTTTYDAFTTANTASSSSDSNEWVARPGMPYKSLDAFFSGSLDSKRALNEDTFAKDAHQKIHSKDSSSFPLSSSALSRSRPLWASDIAAGPTIPSATGRLPLPLSMTKPQRWRCVACQQENSPMAMRCASCETSRYNDEEEEEEEEEEAVEEVKKDHEETEANEEREESTISLVESEDLEEKEEVEKNVDTNNANTSESEENKDEVKTEGHEEIMEAEEEDDEHRLDGEMEMS